MMIIVIVVRANTYGAFACTSGVPQVLCMSYLIEPSCTLMRQALY